MICRLFGYSDDGLPELQKDYFIMETALSLYVTNCLGYDRECYIEKRDGLVDYLAKNHRGLVEEDILGATFKRKFCTWQHLTAARTRIAA